jgi:hypothetical protein
MTGKYCDVAQVPTNSALNSALNKVFSFVDLNTLVRCLELSKASHEQVKLEMRKRRMMYYERAAPRTWDVVKDDTFYRLSIAIVKSSNPSDVQQIMTNFAPFLSYSAFDPKSEAETFEQAMGRSKSFAGIAPVEILGEFYKLCFLTTKTYFVVETGGLSDMAECLFFTDDPCTTTIFSFVKSNNTV